MSGLRSAGPARRGCEALRRAVVVELVGERRHPPGRPAVDLKRRTGEVRIRDQRAESRDRRGVGAERVLGLDRRSLGGRHAQHGGDRALVALVGDRRWDRNERATAHGHAEDGDEEALLVVVDAVEDRHVGEAPGGERRPDRLRKDLAVDDARDCSAREVADEVRDGQAAEARGGLVRATRLGGEGLPGRFGVGARLLVERERAALHDRPLEEPARAGRDQVREHRHATGRLPGDRDVARIASELCDVAPYPAQRRLLVHQAVVAGRTAGPRRERRVGEEAERAQPVVDRDDDDAGRRELRSVVVAAGILGEAAAVDPDQHRPVSLAAQRRRGDVEVQAVLSKGPRPREPARRLRAARRELGRVTNTRP